MDRLQDATPVLVPDVVSPGHRDNRPLYEHAKRAWLSQFAARTREGYTDNMRQYERWCATHDLEPVDSTRQHVQAYMVDLERRGLMASTRARYLATLQSFFAYVVDEELLDRDPTAKVKCPRVETRVQRPVLDRLDSAKFFEAAERLGPMYYALGCVLVFNGLRASEVCALNIETMSSDRGHQTIVVHGKGGTIDTVPLSPMTFWAIAKYVGDRAAGPVFLNAHDTRMKYKNLYEAFGRIREAASITKHLTPHSARRTFITAALDAGVPVRDVQHSARHKDSGTTSRYDQGRQTLDAHATYIVTGFLSG